MSEFDVIKKYFAPLTMGQHGPAELRDDAAVLSVPNGHELVVSSDTLNEGTHFLEGEAPDNIAHKALRTNLSDLAAMGADAMCYQMNIAFPNAPSQDWLAAFSAALLADNQKYGVFCSGGDTTTIKGEHLSISITAMGSVSRGQAVRRMNAKEGDRIILTGLVGDAVLGLKVLRDGLDEDLYSGAVARYKKPQPQMTIAPITRLYAHAAADISDGLLADCMQIATASGLGAEIDLDALQFSADVQRAIQDGVISLQDAVCGGDDYELILSMSEANRDAAFKKGLRALDIGRFSSSANGLSVFGSGSDRFDFKTLGWKHF